MPDVLTIRLWEPYAECRLCGAETRCHWGVPMYEGNLLSNDFKGEWFGQPACKACHDAHDRGELLTYDHLYTTYAKPLFEAALLSETAKALRFISLLKHTPKLFRAIHWL